MFSQIMSDLRDTYRMILDKEQLMLQDPTHDYRVELINNEYIQRASLVIRWLFNPAHDMLVRNLIEGLVSKSESIKAIKLLMVCILMMVLLGFMLCSLFYGTVKCSKEYSSSLMMLGMLPTDTIISVSSIRAFVLNKIVK